MFGKKVDEVEKRKKMKEKQLKKFYKSLKLNKNATEKEIDEAVLRFAKTCKYGWGDLVLSERQKADRKFMLDLFSSNYALVESSKVPKAFQNDQDFVLEFLKLNEKKILNSSYNKSKKVDGYEYRNMLKGFELSSNPEFLARFAETFPDCNFLSVFSDIAKDKLCVYGTLFGEDREKYNQMFAELPRALVISQARHWGRKALKYLPSQNPNFIEAVITGIECDGFESLSCLPKEMIYKNRALIAVAANSYEQKDDAINGLKRYLDITLSPVRDSGEWSFLDVSYFPLRKAIIKDDSLFESINLPEEIKTALRVSVSNKDAKEFYDKICPYDERKTEVEKKPEQSEKPAQEQTKTNADGKQNK